MIEPMVSILNIHHLKKDPISENGYIGDMVFSSTLGTPESVWPHPTTKIGSNNNFHGCLNTSKEPRQSLDPFLNPISAWVGGRGVVGQKCPTPYIFVNIFQTTCTIILKFSVSKFFIYFGQENQKLENFTFTQLYWPHPCCRWLWLKFLLFYI